MSSSKYMPLYHLLRIILGFGYFAVVPFCFQVAGIFFHEYQEAPRQLQQWALFLVLCSVPILGLASAVLAASPSNWKWLLLPLPSVLVIAVSIFVVTKGLR